MTVEKRRERERRERRASILNAAGAVFKVRGFEQATMDDIAQAAELSKGTLYLYFKSKDDLFTALASRALEEVVSEVEALVRTAPTGIAAIRGMVARFADKILAEPQYFRLMMGFFASGHLLDPDTPSFAGHRLVIERIVRAFVTAMERGKRDCTVRVDIEPVQTSSLLWGGLLGTMLLRINGDELARRFPQPLNFNTFVDGYIQLVCDGLQPDATKIWSRESETLS